MNINQILELPTPELKKHIVELFSKYPSDWKKSITKKKPCNCKKRFKKTNK